MSEYTRDEALDMAAPLNIRELVALRKWAVEEARTAGVHAPELTAVARELFWFALTDTKSTQDAPPA